MAFLLIKSSSDEWVTLAAFLVSQQQLNQTFWLFVASLGYLIFEVRLFYDSCCANLAFGALLRMIGAHCNNSFSWFFCPIRLVIPHIPQLSFCLETCNVVQALIICCSSNSLSFPLSVLAWPKYRHLQTCKCANICTKMHPEANTSIQRWWKRVKQA